MIEIVYNRFHIYVALWKNEFVVAQSITVSLGRSSKEMVAEGVLTFYPKIPFSRL